MSAKKMSTTKGVVCLGCGLWTEAKRTNKVDNNTQ